MQTANEDEYLARIQEIVDGHPSLGSPFFFEYKNQPPVTPPTGEFFYALPAMLLDVSPVNILLASRFYLPFVLFLLIYFLIWKLSVKQDWGGKINAASGALLVTLGYDLVDYRSVIDFLSGRGSIGGDFLIWSRPVNPVLGAIFLFSFLILVLAITQNTKRYRSATAGAALFLALMIGSYFFSWGLAASITGVLILFYFFKKEYLTAIRLSAVLLSGALLSLPYWVNAWRASLSPWFYDSVLRSGLFYTHYPVFNKLLLAVIAIYLITAWFFADKFKEGFNRNWYWFCLSMMLGGLVAYNQQIITGRTVWPYHFVQYTIPIAIVAFMVLAHNVIREKSRYFWAVLVFAAAVSSVLFGIYTQAITYAQFSSRYADLQNYSALFDWLNRQEKDCVVLAVSEWDGLSSFDYAIPAFTHCNLYEATAALSLMPEERILHNYFTLLFLKGVTAQNIEDYMAGNKQEPRTRLAANWKGIYNVKDFPDFSDEKLEKRLAELPQNYRDFLKKDFKSELSRYRLDYVLIQGEVPAQVADFVKNLAVLYESGDIRVYGF